MYLPGCLVSVSHPTSKNKDASCSGILVSEKHGLVLTHSALVASLLSSKSEKTLKNLGKISGNEYYFPKAKIVLNPVHRSCSDVAVKDDLVGAWNVHSEKAGHFKTALLNVASSPVEEKTFESYTGAIQYIWQADEFSKCVSKLFPRHEDWKFADDPPVESKTQAETNSPTTDPEKNAFLLPYFVLIAIQDWPPNSCDCDPLVLTPNCLRRGHDVYTMGTPFGALSPAVFMNSISKGIVCNVTGPNNALFLTDARCIPGTEGGLLLADVDRRPTITGMIVAPLCWKANEWIGLTICCAMHDIINSLCSSVDVDIPMDEITYSPETSLSSRIDPLPYKDVVLVQCGATWGSGVVLSDNCGSSVVITCSHVIKNNDKVWIRHDYPSMSWHKAERLFASPSGLIFDIAVLLVSDLHSEQVWSEESCGQNCALGEDVYMIGHAIFGKERRLTSSISRGTLSKVVKHKGTPVMIQSTCAVHPGASGGPLVTPDGKLVGIVACNAKDTVSGASFPHVNLSIPVELLYPVIANYFDTKDKKVFSELLIADSHVQKLWDLKATPVNCKL